MTKNCLFNVIYICAIKQIDISFLCVCSLIDDKLQHIVKVCCGNHWPVARDFQNNKTPTMVNSCVKLKRKDSAKSFICLYSY